MSTPAQLWSDFRAMCNRNPIDDALLAELKAQKANAGAERGVLTANYREWIALIQAFYACDEIFQLRNMVQLKEGLDSREASSYDVDNREMRRFLHFYKTVRMAPIHGIIHEEVAREFVWEIVTRVICKQCIRPDRCVEVPLPDGRKVPLSNRREHRNELDLHKDAVVDWFLKAITPEEYAAMFKLPGTKDEKKAKYGFSDPKRLLTYLHTAMSVESGDSFNNYVDWLTVRGLECPRILVLSMVVHGISDIDGISANVNRVLIRKAGQHTTGEPAHIDMDAREVFKTRAAAGSKMGINPQSVEAVPGCSERVWEFILAEYEPHFKKLGCRQAAKSNMPKDADDFLGLNVLAATKFAVPGRTLCLWQAETIHSKGPLTSKLHHSIGTYSALGIPTQDNPVKPSDAYACYLNGTMPPCYPSGFEGKGVANSLPGRSGLQKYHFNYPDRVEEMLEHVIDPDPCADGVRFDATGTPHQHFVQTQQQSYKWYRALPVDPPDLARLHAHPLSNTGRAILGMPHAPVHITLPEPLHEPAPAPAPHVIVISDSDDEDEPPAKRHRVYV